MKKSALFVINYITGIAETGVCALFLNDHSEVLENTNKIIKSFRKLNLPIFFIRLTFNENYQGLPKHAPNANQNTITEFC